MQLQIKFKQPGFADCDIRVRAKGAIMAMVYWATETGSLAGWLSLAAVPIAPTGEGTYRLDGHRAIPPEATHICARCITPDFLTVEEALAEIPDFYRPQPETLPPQAAFSIMSDLHLSGEKSHRADRALRQAACPALLLVGDMTNDGFTEEFAVLKACIESAVPDKLIFPVAGNHDFLLAPNPNTPEQYEGYHAFQDYLLERTRAHGVQMEMDASGAYAADVDGIDVIGLQCVTYGRRFVFPQGTQLKWLEQHLDKSGGWHIVMCHAPLLAHNPQRNENPPYLSRDDQLQQIIDAHDKIIFLSGHTHISPNGKRSCVEYIPQTQTLYINTGSAAPTQLSGEPLMPADWKDGVVMELRIYENKLEVKTRSASRDFYYPRGYYRFSFS